MEAASGPSAPRTRRTPARTSGRPTRSGPPVSLRTIATVVLVSLLGLGAVRAVTAVGARAAEPGPTGARPSIVSPQPSAGSPGAQASAAATADGAGSVGLDPVAGQSAVDWAGVLAALDAGRRTALASGSTDELARWE